MTDTFDHMRAAAERPSLGNKIDMLTRLEDVFAGLCQSFPDNPHLRAQRDTIAAAKTKVAGLSARPHLSAEDLFAELSRLEAEFPTRGAGASTLKDWGLLP